MYDPYAHMERVNPGFGRVRFGREELRQIGISVGVLTLAFALVLMPRSGDLLINFAFYLGVSFVVVLTGFMLHELAHKFVAQRYGAWAEFRMSLEMLFLAILTAWWIGWLFAAPGAVQIYDPQISKSQYGKIAASGPMMNLFLAFVFMPLLSEKGFLYEIGQWGVLINLLLAGFNMLPISVLDGRKVLAWSAPVYAGLFILVILVGLMFAGMLIPP